MINQLPIKTDKACILFFYIREDKSVVYIIGHDIFDPNSQHGNMIGGSCDYGEDPLTAAGRECEEETSRALSRKDVVKALIQTDQAIVVENNSKTIAVFLADWKFMNSSVEDVNKHLQQQPNGEICALREFSSDALHVAFMVPIYVSLYV